jgi:hypothetical protein
MRVQTIRVLAGIFLATGALAGAVAATGDPYVWPSYTPSLTYNFKQRMPAIPMPTKDLDDCSGVVGTQSSDWWTFKWGKNKKSLVTAAAITPMLARYNKDFGYFRDSMGWAPDLRAQKGYRSAIYLMGSGLCTDSDDSTVLGGYQSAIGAYPMVLASYYPVYSYDPACTYSDRETQMGGMIHEGIHCLLASLPGAKQAAWFQEGGNTWLQQQAAAQQTHDYSSMGFLNAPMVIAPFQPIECYSGWLQDGSFGGPSAEGVNMYNSSGAQVCTWRTLLGGTQYGNLFPVVLAEMLGDGVVPWIWNYCPGRVLEGMGDSLGDTQMRRLIMEYHARLTLLDVKEWSTAAKQLLDDNFGSSLGPEWSPYNINCAPWIVTPYAKTTDSSGTLVPENRTTPGWSGANEIPLKVTGATVSVTFLPIGQNMSLQLCYRATDGTPVYGTPVTSGTATLRLDKPATNNVVIAVVCNTDYKYLGDATRMAHYDYRLQVGTGVSTADVNTKWYNTKLDYTTSIAPRSIEAKTSAFSKFDLANSRGAIVANYTLTESGPFKVSLYTAYGSLIAQLENGWRDAGTYSKRIDLSKMGISPGTFLVTMKAGSSSETRSITVVR